jgi:DNA helicase-2/ATP-dependent DNA helicase PcrA
MSSRLHTKLNKKQQAAVEHINGPSVILAGAGSGKTRVLIHKVMNFIEKGVKPKEIVMITFTNKAAQEMKERIKAATDIQTVLGYVGTFHSFCCQILRREAHNLGIEHSFSIYDDNDQAEVIKHILKKIDNKRLTPSYVQYRISAAKNQLIPPSEYLNFFSEYTAASVAEVYTEYQKELKKNQAFDFDDLIMQVVLLFNKYPEILVKYQEKYKYLLVDEFQDTNFAQYTLTKQLAAKYNNVTVVGDFSQSIYSWRGADIRNLEKFKEDFPDAKEFQLEENYRSTQRILDFAYDVIEKNQTHPVLHLFTSNAEGEEIIENQAENEQDEAIYIASEIRNLARNGSYMDCAVLYRTNAQSRVIEEAFLHFGIPYTLIGGTRFYERKEVKDILSYLRLFANPQDEVAKERIIKIGKKRWDKFKVFYQKTHENYMNIETNELIEDIFKETGYLELYNAEDPEDYSKLENIKELKSVAVRFPNVLEFLEQVALVESEYSEGEKKGGKNQDGVRLMTLHQAKGLEFPYVFIAGVEEGILPHVRSVDDLFQLEEERRLFYVGITRAQKKLYITYTQRRFIFGRRSDTRKSRFIGGDDEREEWYSA